MEIEVLPGNGWTDLRCGGWEFTVFHRDVWNGNLWLSEEEPCRGAWRDVLHLDENWSVIEDLGASPEAFLMLAVFRSVIEGLDGE